MFPVRRSFGHCSVGSCLGSVSAVCAHCWTAASESEVSMPPAKVSPAQMLMIPGKGGITHSQRASDMDSLPRWLSGKECTCQAGDAGLKSLGQEALEEEMASSPVAIGNPMDRRTRQAIVHGISESHIRLSD